VFKKEKMNKAILMILLTVLSSSATAQWVEVGSNSVETVYVDLAVVRKDGNTVEMWDLFDFKSSQAMTLGKQYWSQMSQHEYDCESKRGRILSFAQYSDPMAEGQELYRDVRLGGWEPLSPDTPLELLWKIACERRDGLPPPPRI
jgi:hypothetical protein